MYRSLLPTCSFKDGLLFNFHWLSSRVVKIPAFVARSLSKLFHMGLVIAGLVTVSSHSGYSGETTGWAEYRSGN